jgi:hypothetical protein
MQAAFNRSLADHVSLCCAAEAARNVILASLTPG